MRTTRTTVLFAKGKSDQKTNLIKRHIWEINKIHVMTRYLLNLSNKHIVIFIFHGMEYVTCKYWRNYSQISPEQITFEHPIGFWDQTFLWKKASCKFECIIQNIGGSVGLQGVSNHSTQVSPVHLLTSTCVLEVLPEHLLLLQQQLVPGVLLHNLQDVHGRLQQDLGQSCVVPVDRLEKLLCLILDTASNVCWKASRICISKGWN